MLYETLSQLNTFLCICLVGFLCGFLFDFKNLILLNFKKKKYLNVIFSFFATFFTLFLCFFANLILNFGQVRFFVLLGFVISFCIQRYFITNFVADFCRKCYYKYKEKRDEKRKKI